MMDEKWRQSRQIAPEESITPTNITSIMNIEKGIEISQYKNQ